VTWKSAHMQQSAVRFREGLECLLTGSTAALHLVSSGAVHSIQECCATSCVTIGVLVTVSACLTSLSECLTM
jgi:hypothetical protein